MTNKQNPTALITGASGGIGLELARLLAKDGYNLVLTARSKEKMEKFAEELGTPVRVIAADLTKALAPREIFDLLEREHVQLDVLVNNAGFGLKGNFAELDTAQQLEMIDLNITSLVHLTRLFLPGMIERKRGRIMNVASTAAFQPGPLMAVYFATKAFVLSFSEAIANELSGSGVTVTCLCPGATETGFAKRAHMEDSPMFRIGAMDAKRVAREGYAAMLRGKTLKINGLRNRIMAESVRLGPRKMVTAIARKANQ